MKFISFVLILSIILFLNVALYGQCPTKGDSQKTKLQNLDTLKNRSTPSSHVVKLSLDDILKPGDDTKRFTEFEYVEIIGYVYDAKYGGSETCNCHTKDKSQYDIHIEIVKDLSDSDGPKRIIVEINRFTRENNVTMDYLAIRGLRKKKVRITGWLFFDEEHKQNAINTSPNGTNIWRATCWEVHPCLTIDEITE